MDKLHNTNKIYTTTTTKDGKRVWPKGLHLLFEFSANVLEGRIREGFINFYSFIFSVETSLVFEEVDR